MKAEKLNVFIDSVTHFFKQIKHDAAQVDTPFINENSSPLAYDYTGIISITGPIEGCVYVSSESPMLRSILKLMGENNTSLGMMKDLIGELANTVAGNARKEFGAEFIISTPVIVEGMPSVQYLPKGRHCYIIPVNWEKHKTLIGICLN